MYDFTTELFLIGRKISIFDKSHHLPVIQLQLTTNGVKQVTSGLEGYIKISFLDDIQTIATTNLPFVPGFHFLSGVLVFHNLLFRESHT